ncbi:hypothetical protein V6N13_114334 [Hibiscus sabdariffa]
MSEPVDLSDNSRLPKKQRRRDEAPPDTLPPTALMDCDAHDSSSHPPSYKDMLTGGLDHVVDVDLVSLDDDDIDLLEDDVQTEYESLPIVCFKCGTYGHVTDLCPLAKASEAETVVQPSPTVRPKTIPSDPFGPWMLVEIRQRRQPLKKTLPDTPVVATSPQGSRFNPIFMDDPAADDFGHPPGSSAELQHVQTTNPIHNPSDIERVMPPSDDTIVHKENTANHKSKGKRSQYVRKPAAVVLAPKNTNIMPCKPGLSLPSSSRLPKGRTVSAVLNPAKHGAVVISSDSAPIFMTKTPLMEMQLAGASTSLADKRLNATSGVDAESMVE